MFVHSTHGNNIVYNSKIEQIKKLRLSMIMENNRFTATFFLIKRKKEVKIDIKNENSSAWDFQKSKSILYERNIYA